VQGRVSKLDRARTARFVTRTDSPSILLLGDTGVKVHPETAATKLKVTQLVDRIRSIAVVFKGHKPKTAAIPRDS
jgi:hypothetical protein